jgi:hypothetical protein
MKNLWNIVALTLIIATACPIIYNQNVRINELNQSVSDLRLQLNKSNEAAKSAYESIESSIASNKLEATSRANEINDALKIDHEIIGGLVEKTDSLSSECEDVKKAVGMVSDEITSTRKVCAEYMESASKNFDKHQAILKEIGEWIKSQHDQDETRDKITDDLH